MAKKRPHVPPTRRPPRTLLVLPEIPDELDPAIKNGLAIRNAAAVEGRCPDCGAVGVVADDPNYNMKHITFEHEADCRVLLDEQAGLADAPGDVDGDAEPLVRLRAYLDELRHGGGDPDELRVILDEIRERGGMPDAMLVINNGSRGPGITDTRGDAPGGWVMEGVLPTGVIAATADFDDAPPEVLLQHGFDVVVLLEMRGLVAPGTEVGQRTYFHPHLGLTAPPPRRVRLGGEA